MQTFDFPTQFETIPEYAGIRQNPQQGFTQKAQPDVHLVDVGARKPPAADSACA